MPENEQWERHFTVYGDIKESQVERNARIVDFLLEQHREVGHMYSNLTGEALQACRVVSDTIRQEMTNLQDVVDAAGGTHLYAAPRWK